MKFQIAFPALLAFLLAAVEVFADPVAAEKVVSNLVAERLVVEDVSAPRAGYMLEQPRAGWIHFESTVAGESGGTVTVTVGAGAAQDLVLSHEDATDTSREAMRHLAAGEHAVIVSTRGGRVLKRLVIRAIPELIYTDFGREPSVPAYGPYDRAFLEKQDVLRNVTTLTIGASESLEPSFARDWRRQGKRVLGGCGVPWNQESAEGVFSYWSGLLEKNPALDGIIVDEFAIAPNSPGLRERYSLERYRQWSGAIQRLRKTDPYRKKLFYAYAGSADRIDPARAGPFLEALQDLDYRISHERYLGEQATEADLEAFLNSYLKRAIHDWRTVRPGIEKHLIINLGIFSMPPMGLNTNPRVDYHVWMDRQVHMVATDRVFEGVAGLQWWTSSYAAEETIAWMSRLYRHYAIEGNTGRLTSDPLMLSHVVNPDFEDGTDGWSLRPAAPGSIAVKRHEYYGRMQGRYLREKRYGPEFLGDTFLRMERSAARPNAISQPIRRLEPGRLYTAKMLVADHEALSAAAGTQKEHEEYAVTVEIGGVDVDASKSFRQAFRSSTKKGLWIDYHHVVFRARHSEATLAVTDWKGPKTPGGPIGQRLAFNFFEVQPYRGPDNR